MMLKGIVPLLLNKRVNPPTVTLKRETLANTATILHSCQRWTSATHLLRHLVHRGGAVHMTYDLLPRLTF